MTTLQPSHPDQYRLPPPPMYGPPPHGYHAQPGLPYPPQPAPRQRTAIACRYCRRRKVRTATRLTRTLLTTIAADPLLWLRSVRRRPMHQLSALLAGMRFHACICTDAGFRTSTHGLAQPRSTTSATLRCLWPASASTACTPAPVPTAAATPIPTTRPAVPRTANAIPNAARQCGPTSSSTTSTSRHT